MSDLTENKRETDTIAVDIVLLPPALVTDLAIKINEALISASGDNSIILGRETSIPHISLSMGCIRFSDMKELALLTEKIAQKYLPIDLPVKGVATVTTSSGERVSGIDIIRTPALLALHKEIMNLVSDYAVSEVLPEMIYLDSGEEISDFTLNYIDNFASQSSYDYYSPHITLGYGEVKKAGECIKVPDSFRSFNIALCHLGNHCTCRKVLSLHSVSSEEKDL
ncbi:MAG: hypothetical protein U9N40_00570 [Euryarchaeota archaeon]|nr:hypothetical protein [Euryarchaeota archaeon]